MQIQVNNLKALVRALDLATYILHDKEGEGVQEMQEVIQDVFAQAQTQLEPGFIIKDSELNEYCTNEEVEQDNNAILEQELEEGFWDSLVLKLAERDVKAAIEKGDIAEDDEQAQLDAEQDFVQKYIEEFEANGVDSLIIEE
jgi:hypothetical protein